MWVKPRETIRQIVAEDPNKSIWVLGAIYGFSSLMNSFQSAALGTNLSLFPILLVALVLSPFWGYAFFSIWGWMISLTGKLFKGQGTFKEVRAAYAWSCVPLMINIPLWILLVFLFGNQLFLNFPDEQIMVQTAPALALFVVLLGKLTASIWSIVLYLNALAAVQKFSILRAIGNVLVAGLLSVVLVWILWVLLFMLLGAPVEQSRAAFQIWNDGSSLEMIRRVL